MLGRRSFLPFMSAMLPLLYGCEKSNQKNAQLPARNLSNDSKEQNISYIYGSSMWNMTDNEVFDLHRDLLNSLYIIYFSPQYIDDMYCSLLVHHFDLGMPQKFWVWYYFSNTSRKLSMVIVKTNGVGQDQILGFQNLYNAIVYRTGSPNADIVFGRSRQVKWSNSYANIVGSLMHLEGYGVDDFMTSFIFRAS